MSLFDFLLLIDFNWFQEQLSQKKAKALSKRVRKMQEIEKKMQEKEFERAFFREFWPENVWELMMGSYD